jgi:methyl coenzyme M reductase subunit D
MMNHFDCDEIGELKEYVGWKVDISKEEWSVTLTQLVLLQSFEAEFELPEGAFLRTPAIAGDMIVWGEEKDQILIKKQKRYHCGVGKLLHMMRWSRPETLNTV